MNCKLIHMIFERNEPFHLSFNRDAQVEAILEIGRVKQINIDFITNLCHHTKHSSQIYWCEIPIVQITCSGIQCEFEILSNTQDILFSIIQPIIQQTNLRYITILVDLSLSGWDSYYEFIMVLNRIGKLLLIPTKEALSLRDLSKMRKHWEIQVKKALEEKEDLKLLDIIAPKPFRYSDFRISIQ